MADGVSIDFSDLYTLAAQLDNVAAEFPKGARAAVEGAAYTAKEQWRKGLEASDVPASASTVQYDVEGGFPAIGATIENSGGTARLQGYAYAREYGSVTVSPTRPAAAAAQAAADDLAKGLAIAGERAIERALGS